MIHHVLFHVVVVEFIYKIESTVSKEHLEMKIVLDYMPNHFRTECLHVCEKACHAQKYRQTKKIVGTASKQQLR